MTKNPIKVLIVDDSAVSRELLAYIIGMDSDLSVIGFAENGMEALQMIHQNRPDIIMTDLEMPIMNGFQLTNKIMKTDPIPIIIVSGAYNPSEIATAFETMEAGALAIIEKPKGIGDAQCIDTARFVTETIKTMSKIKLTKVLESGSQQKAAIQGRNDHINSLASDWNDHKFDAVGIGASVGGPKAIRYILSQLSTNFPVPIFIVQHITASFIEGFVHWLKNSSTFDVKVVENGDIPQPNTVYICPDNMVFHLESKEKITLTPLDSQNQTSHSISELFDSMAQTYGSNSIGVLLTGIGSDGAKALLKMKNLGAFTIAQNQSTSVKFDMPKSAIDIEATVKILPLEDIPIALEKLLKGHSIQ